MKDRRISAYLIASTVAAALLALSYLVFVHTGWGQRFDDLAFDGRAVEDPEITAAANDALHRVTRSSLVLLTAAIVAVAFARRRWRLAIVAGASIFASVVITETLKLHVLTRPDLDGVSGIAENSFPSGHATIGMALSLGLVMVTPHARRWIGAGAATAVSMFFGVGVLATGWHRPSDVIGAYLVCVVVFAFATALLLRWRGPGSEEMGPIEERIGPGTAVIIGVLAVATAAFVLVESFTTEGLRTVEFAVDYLAVSVVILATSAGIVIGYHQSLRGVSLDGPRET